MYDIIKNLINHAWQSNYTSDQQYIYYIAGTVIILFVVWVFDIFTQLVKAFRRGGERK